MIGDAELLARIKSNLPNHVAIIMDGNGRWAKTRGKIRVFGHRNAVTAVRAAVSLSSQLGIKNLTLFAFSSENWRRPKDEVDFLLDLFAKFLRSELKSLHEQNVKINVIGDLSKFSVELQQEIHHSCEVTAQNDGLILNIAANYGGRWDIVNACKRIIQEDQIHRDNLEELTEDKFAEYLDTSSTEVDLMIRTGGEKRISNFLIWQLAYAEIYVTDLLWPDFNEEEYTKALLWFAERERRFGYTGDQIKNQNTK